MKEEIVGTAVDSFDTLQQKLLENQIVYFRRKAMKLTLRFTLCLTLVLTLLFTCAVSPMALSDEMTHVYDSGTVQYLNGTYTYTTDTAACYTSAQATLTFGRSATITANIEACLLIGYEYEYNYGANAIDGTSVTATTNNIYYGNGIAQNGVIVSAIADYRIGTRIALTETVY